MRATQSVVVGMATYRRPELLLELLQRLMEQIAAAPAAVGPTTTFQVVVVDNDPDGSARSVVESIVHDSRVRYVIEARPGISHARNRILDEAEDSDVLILLDDDELPHEGWLTSHLETHRRYRADAVSGPVHAIFEGDEDPWVRASGYYLGQRGTGRATGTAMQRAATNNLLLDMDRVRELGLRFDLRFGMTGGEDSLFTGQLTRAGGKMVWCAEAVVDDLVPAARNTRRFNLSRQFAQASSHVRVDRELEGSALARVGCMARWLLVGSGQVVKGIGLAIAGWIMRDLGRRAQGESRVARGLGVFAGCLGIEVSPYARLRPREKRGR
ncbi:glycosyltransferase [Ruania albidiflava]|uniref:glycosyltransferase family 2 protein n=1 Tax=Ruania albidiflava TaxID=366586 RepID=UPI000A002E5B